MELKRIEAEVKMKEIAKGIPSRETIPHVAPVRLPKLELSKFNGNILKWQEFWDAFEATIHKNQTLQHVNKFNYLKAELIGNAQTVISGLELTNNNYEVAVKLLQERYGNKQLMLDAHHNKLMELPVATNTTTKLRATFDTIEKHLRSLESLGENTEQRQTISLIRSNLPKNLIARLDEYKDE